MNTSSLSQLITESYDAKEAERALAFRPHEQSLRTLSGAGYELLRNFPYKPGACAMMTALLVQCIRDTTSYPIHAVAGGLLIDDQQVFGADPKANKMKGAFDATNMDWDGHCWVIFGSYIADASLCRTAHSPQSPRLLKERILTAFRTEAGMIAAPAEKFSAIGIRFDAKHVLTKREIEGLVNGAAYLIQQSKSYRN
jgi:hypothetical protein